MDDEKISITLPQLFELAQKAHQAGMMEQAEEFYQAIINEAPTHSDALHFYGVLKHQTGHSEAGLKLVKAAAKISPKSSDIHNNMGNILREMGAVKKAEKAYRRALSLCENDANALCNLAVVLRGQNKDEQAMATLKQAISINPEHGESYHNLGNLYRDQRKFDDAIFCYEKAVEFQSYKLATGRSLNNLANILRASGRRAEAEKVLRDWLVREPENPVASHMLAALTGDSAPAKASRAYVVQTFQNFASTFDESLERLDYRAPELVGKRVEMVLPAAASQFDVCDLGCGTGLVAKYLKPYAKTLTGMDLSISMLTQAKKRKLYDQLIEDELGEFLENSGNKYDLMTCVDTLCYIGELERIIKASGMALRPNGWFCFTVEKLKDDPGNTNYKLAEHGRYLHSQHYLLSLLEGGGYSSIYCEEVILRKESGAPVEGLLVSGQILRG